MKSQQLQSVKWKNTYRLTLVKERQCELQTKCTNQETQEAQCPQKNEGLI